MKRIHFLLLILSLLAVTPTFADKYIPYQLQVTEAQAQKIGNTLQMQFVLDYSQLVVPTNDQLMVRPVIISAADTVRLPYILFPGKNREKANQRKMRLYGNESILTDAYSVIYPEGQENAIYTYQQQLPFERWMYGAKLELQQDVYGCADCHRVLASLPLSNIANPPQVAFIIPVKDTIREERALLYVSFPWDQAVILPTFRNNAAELAKIDYCMNKITSERPGELRKVTLVGYASPEGTYAYNTRLVGRRIRALKNYITEKYPDTEQIFNVDSIPEDWAGVRRWVDSSNLQYRTEVINIIDNTPDPDARDNEIRRLDNGLTYRTLLNEAYPPLRRVEYIVNYNVTPLSLTEYQNLYIRHPEQLSPYELYMLAQTYPDGSPEFNEIILLTARLYPQNTAANNNAAALALRQEDVATARAYLQRCGDLPQAKNNQGALLMIEGKIPEACQCFLEAQASGCQEATLNLHNLERAHLFKP